MRILLVCLGNICRSPTAEAAVREALLDAGLDAEVEVDSAGTGDWHIGDPPDARMIAAAGLDGLRLDGCARLVTADDLDRFDLVLAMDRKNLADLRALARTPEAAAKVRLFREFDEHRDGDEVPDPYFGAEDGFRRVVPICRAAAAGLVRHLQATGVPAGRRLR